MTSMRKLLASLLLLFALGGATAACNSEADVDSGEDGDGVEIQGDIDAKEGEDE